MPKIIYTIFAIITLALLVPYSPAYASKLDDRIESSAKKSYVFKTFLKDDDIKIQSKNGAVVLTGFVSEEAYKSLAEVTVAGLSGVKKVDNRLEVKGAPPTANSDAWIREKVKFILLFHRSVNAVKTEVEVKDGVVTLRGNATSLAQKELATEYAKDVEEVKEVKNEMTVTVAKADEKTPQTVGDNIDDASITAQVKMALLLHRSTTAANTTVTTKRGVVTVNGKVKDAATKDQIAKFVKDVRGVKGVNNKITIE